MPERPDFIGNTVDIVTAYVGNNVIPSEDLPGLITSVHQCLASANGSSEKQPAPPVSTAVPKPAVPIKASLSSDFIVCLEDGQAFKCLTKHIWAKYRMTPRDYRTKWGLKDDYPMTAPSYSALRTALAKKMGLGKRVVRKSIVAA